MNERPAPPQMAGWNLALRFILEVAALVALGVAGWNSTTGLLRWVAAIGMPLAAAAVWGVFNVVDDPSRSGRAPVPVRGWVRLIVEVAVLGAGAVALGLASGRLIASGFGALVIAHYLFSWDRVRWLLGR